MDNIKLMRAKVAAMGSIGVLIQYDREALLQILDLIKDHLLEEQLMATRAMFEANQAIRKAQNGKA